MMSPGCPCVRELNALQNSMMFTPCWPSAGPIGGAGVALPAGTWSLTSACTGLVLAIRVPFRSRGFRPAPTSRGRAAGPAPAERRSGRLDRLDLQEVELDGRRAPEDRHHHLHLLPLGIHLVDDAGEVGERTVHHLHVLA